MKIRFETGEEVELQPRAAEVLRNLIEVQDEIEQVPFGSWSCHFAGRKVKPELSRSYRGSEIPPPGVKVKVS